MSDLRSVSHRYMTHREYHLLAYSGLGSFGVDGLRQLDHLCRRQPAGWLLDGERCARMIGVGFRKAEKHMRFWGILALSQGAHSRCM